MTHEERAQAVVSEWARTEYEGYEGAALGLRNLVVDCLSALEEELKKQPPSLLVIGNNAFPGGEGRAVELFADQSNHAIADHLRHMVNLVPGAFHYVLLAAADRLEGATR